MMQVALARLRSRWPEATIQVLTDDAERLMADCPDIEPLSAKGRHAWIQCGALHSGLYRPLPDTLKKLARIFQHALKISPSGITEQLARLQFRSLAPTDVVEVNRYIEAISRADLVVATGMGGITDTFPEYAFALLSVLDLAMAKCAMTALVGHGLGPLVSPDLVAIAKRVLPKIDFISLREGLHSLPLLRSIGVSLDRVVTTGDDAIELAYERRSELTGNHLGINIRRASYSAIGSTDIEKLRTIIVSVVQVLKCPVAFVPISQHPDES